MPPQQAVRKIAEGMFEQVVKTSPVSSPQSPLNPGWYSYGGLVDARAINVISWSSSPSAEALRTYNMWKAEYDRQIEEKLALLRYSRPTIVGYFPGEENVQKDEDDIFILDDGPYPQHDFTPIKQRPPPKRGTRVKLKLIYERPATPQPEEAVKCIEKPMSPKKREALRAGELCMVGIPGCGCNDTFPDDE